MSICKAMAASEPVCDSAALGGGLALLLEWEMWPSEGLCLPSLGQVFTHCRMRNNVLALSLAAHKAKSPGNEHAELPSVANPSA